MLFGQSLRVSHCFLLGPTASILVFVWEPLVLEGLLIFLVLLLVLLLLPSSDWEVRSILIQCMRPLGPELEPLRSVETCTAAQHHV